MIDKEEEKTDPISQLLGRITDVNYCYRVNRATGTKLDMKRKSGRVLSLPDYRRGISRTHYENIHNRNR